MSFEDEIGSVFAENLRNWPSFQTGMAGATRFLSRNRETPTNEVLQVVDSLPRPDKIIRAAQVRVSSVAESLHTRPAIRSVLHCRIFSKSCRVMMDLFSESF